MRLFGLYILLLSCAALESAERSSPKSREECAGYDCLKQYVDKPDPNYAWSDTGVRLHGVETTTLVEWTGYVINMTSQQWLTPEDSSRSIWWHMMVVVVPQNVEYTDTSFLWISSGSNDGNPIPDENNDNVILVGNFAAKVKTIGTVLFQIPNQPISFPGDPWNEDRKEDGVIAYTWWHYLNDPNSNPEWLLRMPMTKASVRAMDTVNAFMISENSPQEIKDLNADPDQFIVAGASKRGWTTWTTSSVDSRVIAAVPVVMDLLNVVKNLHHEYKAYGGWTVEFEDYYKMNLTKHLDDKKFQDMMDIVDVYEYRDKLLMPKLVCDGANDEFFLPDDTQYWWNDMPNAYELNRLLIIPNAEHFGRSRKLEVLPSASEYCMSIAAVWARELLQSHEHLSKLEGGKNKKLSRTKSIQDRNTRSLKLMDVSNIPRFNWTIDSENGDIIVNAETQPAAVYMWHATTCNEKRRDYRIINLDDPCTCGIKVDDNICSNLRVLWKSEVLKETIPGSLTWIAHRDPPTDGRWTAFFVSLQFIGHNTDIPIFPEFHYNTNDRYRGNEEKYDFTTLVSIVPNTFPYTDCYGEGCFGHLL